MSKNHSKTSDTIIVSLRMSQELLDVVGLRLATIRVQTGERTTFGELVENLLIAWLQMPFEPYPDTIEEASPQKEDAPNA